MTKVKGGFFKISKTRLFKHSVCWLLFISYEMYLFYYAAGTIANPIKYFFYYGCNITLFYCHVWILITTLRGKSAKLLKLFALIIIELTVYMVVKISGDFYFTNFYKSFRWFIIRQTAILDLMRCLYFVAFATLYWSLKNINRFANKAAQAEIGRLKAANQQTVLEFQLAKSQNAYLQHQMNPHLLLNSLTFIYDSVYKISREAAEDVGLLADIMHYSLEVSDADEKIAVIRETEQIENLIQINRNRFHYPLPLAYQTRGNLYRYQIIPLVLVTLTENLFKHGDLKDKKAIIDLDLQESGRLRFYTYNHKRPVVPFTKLKSTGLENIRTRLNFTYGNQYRLNINQTPDIYESELILQL